MSDDAFNLEINLRLRSLDELRGFLDMASAFGAHSLLSDLSMLGKVNIPTRGDAENQAEGSYPTPAGGVSEASGGEIGSAYSPPPTETEAPKRKRGRPAKEKAPDQLVESNVQDDTLANDPLPQTLPFPPDQAMVKSTPGQVTFDPFNLADIPMVPAGLVKQTDILGELGVDMAPAEKLQRARQMLLDLLAREPGRKAETDALLGKYGVPVLSAVPVERAAEFLADAMMIFNSEPGAA